MIAPEKLKTFIFQTQKHKCHQGCLGKIEPLCLHGLLQVLELCLLLWRWQHTPVFVPPRQFHVTAHYLKRLVQALPHKTGPEDGMPLDSCLPGTLECGDIKRTVDSAHQLLAIHTGVRRALGVEEESLLKRRERINIFYILQLHANRLQELRLDHK